MTNGNDISNNLNNLVIGIPLCKKLFILKKLHCTSLFFYIMHVFFVISKLFNTLFHTFLMFLRDLLRFFLCNLSNCMVWFFSVRLSPTCDSTNFVNGNGSEDKARPLQQIQTYRYVAFLLTKY